MKSWCGWMIQWRVNMVEWYNEVNMVEWYSEELTWLNDTVRVMTECKQFWMIVKS